MACIQDYRMNVSSPFNVNIWLTQKHPHLHNALYTETHKHLEGSIVKTCIQNDFVLFKEDSASATLGSAVFLVCLS